MLHSFGLYPVSLLIDIDSYDGDWRHVARFRNRSGWLAVAEAEIWSGNDLCTTLPIIVGCDEHEGEIPAFIAANLLGCATSYPEPCYEFAPLVLDDLLDVQRAEVRKRWLRENVAAIAAIHEQAEQALLEVETKVAVQTRKSDKAIARMRRQRRFLPTDDPRRALLADAIAEEEEWQDRMIDWLGARRDELRRHYDALERKASKGLRPRLAVELLYVVNWRHQPAPTIETRDIWDEVRRDIHQTAMQSAFPLDLDAKQMSALKKLARDPDWVIRKGEIISAPEVSAPPLRKPTPRKGPPRRVEVDWDALRAASAKQEEQPEAKCSQAVTETPVPTPSPSTSPESDLFPSASPQAKPKTRLERTEAKRDDVVAQLADIRKQRAGFPPGSKRFLDAQRKERRFTNHVAALDAEIASMRSRIQPAEPTAPPTPKPTPPAPLPNPEAAPFPRNAFLDERTTLLKKLKSLELEGRKFLSGSPKTQRNQMERAEVNRRIAALDRRIDAMGASLAVAPAVTSAPDNASKTKQDLLDEMLRRAGASTGDPPSA